MSERIDNNHTEAVSDERINEVIGKALDTITIDSSVNAIIVASKGEGANNGLRVGKAFEAGIIERGGKAQVVTCTPRPWEEPRDEDIAELLRQPEFNLVIIPDIDMVGHDGKGRETPYILGDQKFTESIYYRRAKK